MEQAAKAVRAHSASVTVLQRSPFRSDLILTMGAWTFAIWMDGSLRAPLCQSPAAPAMYSAGCWSPARPGWVRLLALHDSLTDLLSAGP